MSLLLPIAVCGPKRFWKPSAAELKSRRCLDRIGVGAKVNEEVAPSGLLDLLHRGAPADHVGGGPLDSDDGKDVAGRKWILAQDPGPVVSRPQGHRLQPLHWDGVEDVVHLLVLGLEELFRPGDPRKEKWK